MKQMMVLPLTWLYAAQAEVESAPASARGFHQNKRISKFTDLMHPSFPDLKSWDLNCRKCCVSTTATTFEFGKRCALKVFSDAVCSRKCNLRPS